MWGPIPWGEDADAAFAIYDGLGIGDCDAIHYECVAVLGRESEVSDW